jgi:hypothetical protein
MGELKMRTAFFAAVVAVLAMATTALAQAPDLASMVGVWKGTTSSGMVQITLTVNSVGPKSSGSLVANYTTESIEAVTLKGDKVFVKFAGGDMTLTVSGGKASGRSDFASKGAYSLNGAVSLTKQ